MENSISVPGNYFFVIANNVTVISITSLSFGAKRRICCPALLLPNSRRNFFHQRVGIALMLSYFRRQPRQIAVTEPCPCAFQHGIAQHSDQTFLPVLRTSFQGMIL